MRQQSYVLLYEGTAILLFVVASSAETNVVIQQVNQLLLLPYMVSFSN